MTTPFDEPAPPRHPQLDALIRAARAQPAPPLKVDIRDVHAESRRRSTRRVAGLALAAGLIGVVAFVGSSWHPPASSDALQPSLGAVDGHVAGPAGHAVVPEAVASAPRPDRRSRPMVELGDDATIERLDGPDAPRPDQLGKGRFRVRTHDRPARLEVGARVLEISAASEVVVDTTVEQASFVVHAGEAQWAPRTLEAGSSSRPSAAASSARAAAALSARAEAALVEGNDAQAVRILRTLVRRHASSAAAKTALIDLARLERKLGRKARAHCAYARFLQRFGTDAQAPSVRSADERLGQAGVRCRGLEPLD